jgi:hypothetical protein
MKYKPLPPTVSAKKATKQRETLSGLVIAIPQTSPKYSSLF